uniref:Mytilin M n=1 Tax=Mytilus galloprovincialis TaxID=29158 RepID=A0A6B9XM67_MYTGA|nr:mytilin M [Mytilus galloprovincialis]
MKVAIILAIIVILAVNEAAASCASRCRSHCRARRCHYSKSVLVGRRCFCKCFLCASGQIMKLTKNEGSFPSDMMPQMNENENTEFVQDMPTGETEQGETGI